MYFLLNLYAKLKIWNLKRENNKAATSLMEIKKNILIWQDNPRYAATADQMYKKYLSGVSLYESNLIDIINLEHELELN